MLVNGQLQDHLPILDRAVQYGDGVFETILIRDAQPMFFAAHLARLSHACKRLQIPLDAQLLQQEFDTFVDGSRANGIVKIIISRGAGGRGYGVEPGMLPTRILQFHPLPQGYERHSQEGVRVFKCAHPVSRNSALAGLKHLNRLDQVMASIELPATAQEGLMCEESGLLIEGVKSNVFLYRDGHWRTPSLVYSGVAGVMRAQIIDFCRAQDPDSVVIEDIDFGAIASAEEVFVCNSVLGIWPVTEVQWDNSVLGFAIGKHTRHLQHKLWNIV